MTNPAQALLHRTRPTVGSKFLLAVSVLVLAVLATAAVGTLGLVRMSARSDVLYDRSLAVTQNAADVVAATYAIYETTLYLVSVHDPQLVAQLEVELDQQLIPLAQRRIAVLRRDYAGDPGRVQAVDDVRASLDMYLALRRGGLYAAARDDSLSEASRTALARRTDALMETIITRARRVAGQEKHSAAAVKRDSDATYRSTLAMLAASVAAVLLLGLAVVLGLIRDMVPRIKRYSEFAADFAAGRPATTFTSHGADEIAALGRALIDMVDQREVTRQVEEQQQDRARRAAGRQAEFVDTLQVTRSEDEAQELLQRHLHRSIADSEVVVLRSNNSSNRLLAATELSPDSELATRLVGAEPTACVAIRLGRAQHEGPDRLPLLSCGLCGGGRPTTCEPLLVGGEVIGSVMVSAPAELDPSQDGQIKNNVAQAAPVLANLRSLALAEFRANTDSLTGLPNKRATEDTMRRMVAQATRSLMPLTAVMLDLDHFKAVNDIYGHALGDEVLAAVGTAIKAGLRASDFGGRFGGEEFVLLLPDTSVDGGLVVAEKLRASIASLSIIGVDRPITASLGIAGLLDHAGTMTGLLREIDKAQYAAKAAGRNCCVVADAEAPAPAVAVAAPAS